MEAAFFISYLLFFCFIITIIPFFKKSGINKTILIFIFITKVIAGIAYAQFYKLPKYYAEADTWRFFRLSLEEKKWLLSDPIAFLKDLFVYGYHSSGSLFNGENSYWNDLKSNIPIKLLAIMNIITNDSYYTDIILFNFIFFIGLVALYKLFFHYYPQQKWLVIIGVFLLPSCLFWCSGIHKDGLILSALSILLYLFDKCMKRGFSLKYLSPIFLASLLLFSLRNYLFFALVPALFCWFITQKYPAKSRAIFFITYSTIIFITIITTLILPSLNPLVILSDKQHEFLQLGGGSSVISQPLLPTFKSFIKYLPNALDMGFLRPHVNEVSNPAYIPAIVETVLVLLLITFSLFFNWRKLKATPFFLFMIFFSISIVMICGYTIPITGAIVRYRSIVLPLLITPLLCSQNLFNWYISKKPNYSKQ